MENLNRQKLENPPPTPIGSIVTMIDPIVTITSKPPAEQIMDALELRDRYKSKLQIRCKYLRSIADAMATAKLKQGQYAIHVTEEVFLRIRKAGEEV